MILDTSFLVDLLNGDEGAVKRATELEERDVPQRIPAQVVYELYVGVGYTETPFEEVSKIQSVLDARPIVKTDDQIAEFAGRVDGQLRRDGERVATSDVLIGATARHFDEPVVTNNVNDFERVGAEIETY